MIDEEGFKGGFVEAEFFFDDKGVVKVEGEADEEVADEEDRDEEETRNNGALIKGACEIVDPSEAAKEPEAEEDEEGESGA